MALVVSLVMPSGAVALRAAAQNQTPYVATRLIGHWRAIMNNTLEDSRAFAPEGVLDQMEVFVSPGAVRVVQDKASDEQLKKVDAVVERFALAVVRAGSRQPDGSVIIQESAVEAAEKAICPVYPFCGN